MELKRIAIFWIEYNTTRDQARIRALMRLFLQENISAYIKVVENPDQALERITRCINRGCSVIGIVINTVLRKSNGTVGGVLLPSNSHLGDLFLCQFRESGLQIPIVYHTGEVKPRRRSVDKEILVLPVCENNPEGFARLSLDFFYSALAEEEVNV